VLATTTTDADGKYLFKDLPPGEYTTKITVPDGYVASTATEQDSALLTTDGASDLTLDFGLYLPEDPEDPPVDPVDPLVGMGDFVWIDANGNGIQDVGELGLEGVLVQLFDPDGTAARDADGQVALAVTGADGSYFIDSLLPGTYYATFTLPEGYAFTLTGEGSSATDSNATPTDRNDRVGRTEVFTIAASVTGDTVEDTDDGTVAVFVNPTIDAGVVAVMEPERPPAIERPADDRDAPADPVSTPDDPTSTGLVPSGVPAGSGPVPVLPLPVGGLVALAIAAVLLVERSRTTAGLFAMAERRRRRLLNAPERRLAGFDALEARLEDLRRSMRG
jgi:hypothetical protein